MKTNLVIKPKTGEFLNLLLWSAEKLARPTFRNLTGSYESWAYRNGLLRQVAILEQRQILERDAGVPDDRVYRLTEQGRLHALGGRDPEERWARPWDGQWRLVLFDLPIAQNTRRERLRRYLRDKGFGWLQNSVWITPDPLAHEREILGDAKINVESLILLEARPCAGESDAEIVGGAWDFGRINHLYARHLKVLDQRPDSALRNVPARKALLRWAAAERAAWLEAVTGDPLLPVRMLPADYLGRKAWRRRIEVLRSAGSHLRGFKHEERRFEQNFVVYATKFRRKGQELLLGREYHASQTLWHMPQSFVEDGCTLSFSRRSGDAPQQQQL